MNKNLAYRLGRFCKVEAPVWSVKFLVYSERCSKRRVLALGIIVVISLLWVWGTFDYALVNWGLNAKPCGRNGFGATFCGGDLERYNREVAEPIQRAARELQQSLNDLRNK